MSDGGPNLLDVNFLVALAWPNHIAHGRAVTWFLENTGSPFATCPMTEAGFARISMNPLIVTEHAGLQAVLGMLGVYRTKYKHVFWPDDLGVADALSSFRNISGHRQVTDAYLVSLAVAHGGRLVTFDSGIEAIIPPHFREKLLLVEL
jgi:uncharacterized protein